MSLALDKENIIKIKNDMALDILKNKYSGFYEQLLSEAQDGLLEKIEEKFNWEMECDIQDAAEADCDLGVNVDYSFDDAKEHINNYNQAIEIAKSLGE